MNTTKKLLTIALCLGSLNLEFSATARAEQPENRLDPEEFYLAARVLSHSRNPAVSFGLSLDQQSEIFDRLLRSGHPAIRDAAKGGRFAVSLSRAIGALAARTPLDDELKKQLKKNFQDAGLGFLANGKDDAFVPKLSYKAIKAAVEETRKIERGIQDLVFARAEAYRSVFQSQLLPLAPSLAGPPAKKPMIDIRAPMRPYRSASPPFSVLAFYPSLEVVNVHGKELRNCVLEIEIEAGAGLDKRFYFLPSLAKNGIYELSPQFGSKPPIASPPGSSGGLISNDYIRASYSVWCMEGSETNQVLAAVGAKKRLRLTPDQWKAAKQAKATLLRYARSGSGFRGEIRLRKGGPIPVELKLGQTERAGQREFSAILKSQSATMALVGNFVFDDDGSYKLLFSPNPIRSVLPEHYVLGLRGEGAVLRIPRGGSISLRPVE
jgi:hypothetical protein